MADSLSAIFKKRSTPPQIRPQLKSQKRNTKEGLIDCNAITLSPPTLV